MENTKDQIKNKIKESELDIELKDIKKKPFNSRTENIQNEDPDNIPEEDAEDLIDGLKEEEEEEEKDTEETGPEVSRLNPESEIITEKDPDELIILPNEDLKKINNKKNNNHPL